MKNYKAYLIDLDGTLYKGNETIDGAKAFISYLNQHQIPHLYVTNNSTKEPEEVATKLSSMGLDAKATEVVTSALATAEYISETSPGASVYMLGGTGLKKALTSHGLQLKNDEFVDYVVIGLDEAVTYEKLATATLGVRNGATFISTNKDAAIPTEEGLLPGNGSLTSVVSVSTGVAPIFVGKPEPIIMEEALRMIGLDREEVLMVGDNYTTDILAGVHARMDTLMVLTGFSSREDVADVPKAEKPTYIMDDLYSWIEEKMS